MVNAQSTPVKTGATDEQNNEQKAATDSGQSIDIGRVVVTPTKTNRSAENAPASLSIITQEDIAVSTAKFTDESMKSVAGVYLKRAKFADTVSSVNIRGIPGDSRNLVLLDGMPINDSYSGGVNWSAIPSGNVKQIEIVKGPFSSLYGRNAMGGVINIITRTPEELDISVKAGYGSYNTFTGHAHFGDKYLGKLGVYASFDYRSTDGHRSYPVRTTFTEVTTQTGTVVGGWKKAKDEEGNSYDSSDHPYYVIGDKGNNFWKQWICSGKIFYDISDDSRISYALNVQQYDYGYRNAKSLLYGSSGTAVDSGTVIIEDNGTQYYKNITPYSFLSGDGRNFSHMHNIDYYTSVGMIDFKTKVGYNEVTNWYTTPKSGSNYSGGPGSVNITDPKRTFFFDAQTDINFATSNSVMAEKHVLTIGAGLRYDYAKGEEWNITDWKDPDSRSDVHGSKYSYMSGNQILVSLYTQLEFGLIKDLLTAYMGARYDHWMNFDGTSRYEDEEKNYSDTDDWQISPKFALLIKPGLKPGDGAFAFEAIRISYGWAYAPPELFKLYKYWEYYGKVYNPNPDLKPERSHSWECGMDFSFAKKWVTLSAAYFGSLMFDMFYNKEVDSTTKKYENAGQGMVHGFEGEVRLFVYDWMEIYGNITYTSTEITENDDDPESEGKQFQKVPELMYNAGIIGRYKYVEGSLNWRFVSKMYANSDNSDTERFTYGACDSVMLLDLKVTAKPVKQLAVSFGVDNLLDRRYYQSYLCQGRTFFGEASVQF